MYTAGVFWIRGFCPKTETCMFPQLKKNTSYTLAFALVIALTGTAHAQSKKPAAPPAPAPAAPQQGDKIDVSDLEKKYWAAKDTDFSVVQNRLFSKEKKFAVSLIYGSLLNDPWSEGPTYGANLGYYFSERYGMELTYTNTQSRDSKATERLRGQSGFPNHNKMRDFYGLAFNWVPFYAKMSALNAAIIYFDMSLSLGAGMTTYEQQMSEGNATKQAPTVTLDVSQHLFLARWLALRADYKMRFYSEDIQWFRAQPTGSRTNSTEINQSSLLMFGLTLYF